ncbi:shikimate dehydrogenase [Halorhodospira neutriphila]|uniref:Shikimate dehydrogenase (NADP(+)) n=1 Tax=Halorhodospira neutriphila TaxID=168379 RepID=A0ABS1E3W7_9GAMM|nr:shikimate dehydrogenase [Halorhodospira neutriphila]
MAAPARYAVIGNPVGHSRSPRIHALFAEQTGEPIAYTRLEAPEAGFAAVAEAFFAGGGSGLNVTVPFKEAACAWADTLSKRARAAAAVNTLRAEADGRRHGDNTDGAGLLRDLRDNLGVAVAGRRLLVIGAGGAARGILPTLLDEAPGEVLIANRTAERAERLAAERPGVRACGLEALAGQGGFDVLLNTTAAGLQGQMPALPGELLASGAAAYDLVYADADTPFMAWARRHGAALVADGLGMLVEQAAESFAVWRGVHPRTAPVIEALRGG